MVHSTAIAYVAVLAFFLFPAQTTGQNGKPNTSAGIELRYSTASRILLSPLSADPLKQIAETDLGGFASVAVRYRQPVYESVQLHAAFEYMRNTAESSDHYGTVARDGFTLYGVEVLGLFRLPFSGPAVALNAGGGAGIVFGRREYSIGGADAASTSSGIAFGIHVIVGMDVFLTESLSLSGELHFRDPQVAVENTFSRPSVVSNGITYFLPTEPLKTKINLNGNMYSIGAAWHF